MKSIVGGSKICFLYLVPCFYIFTSVLIAYKGSFTKTKSIIRNNENFHHSNRLLLQTDNATDLQCIPSGINSFPEDFFNQEQRQKGGVLVHVFILFYVCATIAFVCDDYFIPALEIIADKLKLPPDVAGATFMAIGASSPELFSSIIGSFVTEGDIGIGAVIGSAVFNILGITGIAGIVLWNEILDIDWYPIVRDCIAYSITVISLILIIGDSTVKWWESLILLLIFFMYITLMYFNRTVEKGFRSTARRIKPACCCNPYEEQDEKKPLLGKKIFIPELLKSQESKEDTTTITVCEQKPETISTPTDTNTTDDNDENSLCPPPSGFCRFSWWLFMLPASILLFLTIPNCANSKYRKFYPLTFIGSIAWLGALSYLAVWMVTIIGYTLLIPDSVSGLTILAVGASVPDLIASVLVTKKGQGNMAISNLVGSNNFDISICLGIPWFVKGLISPSGEVKIQSAAMSFATATLFVTLIIFFFIFVLSGWKLNRAVGFMCLLVYGLFIVVACLFEFNVFGDFNLPNCYP